jgi:hypothetical protein
LNRQGGSNLQDEHLKIAILQIFWGVHLALSIGGVIAERNILSSFAYSSGLRLFNLAENENVFLHEKAACSNGK